MGSKIANILGGLSIILLVSACETQAVSEVAQEVDEVQVLGNTLTVVEQNNECFLVHKDSKFKLLPTPPCHFLRRANNTDEALFFSYPDVGVDAALIVTGTPISKNDRVKYKLAENVVCGKKSQGVLIKDNVISMPEKYLSMLLCRDYGGDEKNFWHIAH